MEDKFLLLFLVLFGAVCISVGVWLGFTLPAYFVIIVPVMWLVTYYAIHKLPGMTSKGAGAMNFIPLLIGGFLFVVAFAVTKLFIG